jgi:hypothetical protein
MAPTTSTDSAAMGGASGPGGAPLGLLIVAAGLLGGCLYWRRLDVRTQQIDNT